MHGHAQPCVAMHSHAQPCRALHSHAHSSAQEPLHDNPTPPQPQADPALRAEVRKQGSDAEHSSLLLSKDKPCTDAAITVEPSTAFLHPTPKIGMDGTNGSCTSPRGGSERCTQGCIPAGGAQGGEKGAANHSDAQQDLTFITEK